MAAERLQVSHRRFLWIVLAAGGGGGGGGDLQQRSELGFVIDRDPI